MYLQEERRGKKKRGKRGRSGKRGRGREEGREWYKEEEKERKTREKEAEERAKKGESDNSDDSASPANAYRLVLSVAIHIANEDHSPQARSAAAVWLLSLVVGAVDPIVTPAAARKAAISFAIVIGGASEINQRQKANAEGKACTCVR